MQVVSTEKRLTDVKDPVDAGKALLGEVNGEAMGNYRLTAKRVSPSRECKDRGSLACITRSG